MKAVVCGGIAAYCVGGVAWDYGQYALGLERLGFEVLYLEDTGLWPTYSFDVDAEADPPPEVAYLESALASLSPTLGRRWHYRGPYGDTHGWPVEEVAGFAEDADVLVNVSGLCLLREVYRRCDRKVVIDTDPGFNHLIEFPGSDRQPPEGTPGYRGHDRFFTYASRLGGPGCPLPDLDLDWRPTVPPVVRDQWRARPPGDTWTTVLSWNNYYPDPEDGADQPYGSKEREFPKVEELPAHTPARLEIAAGGWGRPFERWRELGWGVRDGPRTTYRPDDYRAYVESSRGELSVAKNVYVATRCGWFSCRSVCYLAAGRPVVLQDTGFSEDLPTGDGLLAFSDLSGAAAGLAAAESDYDHHAAAAEQLAAERFEAELVLSDLLTRAEVNE